MPFLNLGKMFDIFCTQKTVHFKFCMVQMVQGTKYGTVPLNTVQLAGLHLYIFTFPLLLVNLLLSIPAGISLTEYLRQCFSKDRSGNDNYMYLHFRIAAR